MDLENMVKNIWPTPLWLGRENMNSQHGVNQNGAGVAIRLTELHHTLTTNTPVAEVAVLSNMGISISPHGPPKRHHFNQMHHISTCTEPFSAILISFEKLKVNAIKQAQHRRKRQK